MKETEYRYYSTFDTKLGWIGVLASKKGLMRITLPQSSSGDVDKIISGWKEQARKSPDKFEDLEVRMRDYFSGRQVSFPDQLDLSGCTSFQQQVWNVTRSIPYGEQRCYGWLASEIGKPQAARAVGNALGANPLPIVIPCHRVIGADGRLCGFGGGLKMKQYLLDLEK